MFKLQSYYRPVGFCDVPLPKHLLSRRYWSLSEKSRISDTFDKTSLSSELHWHLLQALHCTGWNNCSFLKKRLSRGDVLLLMKIFRLYPGFNFLFEHSSVHKTLFLSACFFWDSIHSLLELDQNFNFGRTISYKDAQLELLLRPFKVLTLHGILHDAVGAV